MKEGSDIPERNIVTNEGVGNMLAVLERAEERRMRGESLRNNTDNQILMSGMKNIIMAREEAKSWAQRVDHLLTTDGRRVSPSDIHGKENDLNDAMTRACGGLRLKTKANITGP